MKNRRQFFNLYLQKFSRAFDKAVDSFEKEDKIYITGILIEICDLYKQEPIDYKKAKALQEDLLKKYGHRLHTYASARLSEYFSRESSHHLDLQDDLKLEDVGELDNFFTDEEHKDFLRRVSNLLEVNKEQYYLEKPKGESTITKEEELSGDATDNKAFTARRRALAMHYLDKHFKISTTGNKAPLAEFTRFLSGNTYDKLYKVLRNPLGYGMEDGKKRAEDNLKKDLEFIKIYFVKLGLTEVVYFIDNDIGSF